VWTGAPANAQNPGDVEYLLTNINATRQLNGLPPYGLNPLLTAAAQAHSDDMAAQAYALLNQGLSPTGAILHVGSDGSQAADRVARAGYAASQVGEVVYGSGIGGAESAFYWWFNSDIHRNNLLHARYTEIGIGSQSGPEGLVLFTVVFAHPPGSPAQAQVVAPQATSIPPTTIPTVAPTQPPQPEPTLAPPSPSPTLAVTHIKLPPAHTATPALPPVEFGPPTKPPRPLARRVLPWIIGAGLLGIGLALYAGVVMPRRNRSEGDKDNG